MKKEVQIHRIDTNDVSYLYRLFGNLLDTVYYGKENIKREGMHINTHLYLTVSQEVDCICGNSCNVNGASTCANSEDYV